MTSRPRRLTGTCRRVLGGLGLGLALLLTATGCRTAAPAPQAAFDADEPATTQSLDERWGVEVVGLRLTAAGHMLDFRYKVLDAAKAAPLFVRANQPHLIHLASGESLPVYTPAKIGPMRNSNPPLEGRVYFMFFPNPGMVRAGDQARLEIGDFSTQLVVE